MTARRSSARSTDRARKTVGWCSSLFREADILGPGKKPPLKLLGRSLSTSRPTNCCGSSSSNTDCRRPSRDPSRVAGGKGVGSGIGSRLRRGGLRQDGLFVKPGVHDRGTALGRVDDVNQAVIRLDGRRVGVRSGAFDQVSPIGVGLVTVDGNECRQRRPQTEAVVVDQQQVSILQPQKLDGRVRVRPRRLDALGPRLVRHRAIPHGRYSRASSASSHHRGGCSRPGSHPSREPRRVECSPCGRQCDSSRTRSWSARHTAGRTTCCRGRWPRCRVPSRDTRATDNLHPPGRSVGCAPSYPART